MGKLWEKYKRFKHRISTHPVVEAGRDLNRIASDLNRRLPGARIDPIAFVEGRKKKR